MSGFSSLLLALVAMLALLSGLALWGLSRVRRARGQVAGRQALLELAARAAADETGGGLLALLAALERQPAGASAVTVKWLAHRTAREGATGLLVAIAWDGNEWRRIHHPGEFASALATRLEADPALAVPAARRLLDEARSLASNEAP